MTGGPQAPDDTTVHHLPSHRGVSVAGPERDAVANAIRDRLGALVPSDYVEIGNIYRSEVLHLLNEGATVDLDVCEGYLPFKFTHQSFEQGDRPVVQVVDIPRPPLRPIISQTISVPSRDLVFSSVTDITVAEGMDPERSDVLIQLAETLRPTSWGIHWHLEAQNANVKTLEREVIERRELLERLEQLMEGDDEVGLLYSPHDFLKVLFPYEAMEGLDTLRAASVPTIPHHHFISSLGPEAGFASEVIEELGEKGEEAAAAILGRALRGLRPGATIEMEELTVTGKRRAWEVDVRSFDGTDLVLVGPTHVGDIALVEIRQGAWTFPTIYFDPVGNEMFRNHTICTPIELRPQGISYVSFGIAVMEKDGKREIVNDEQLSAAVAEGTISAELASRAREIAADLAAGKV